MNKTEGEPFINIIRVLGFFTDYNVLEHPLEQEGPILMNESVLQEMIIPGYAVMEENSKEPDVAIWLEYYFQEFRVGANCVKMSQLSDLVTSYKIYTEWKKCSNKIPDNSNLLTHISIVDKHCDDPQKTLAHFSFQKDILSERVINADAFERTDEEDQLRYHFQVDLILLRIFLFIFTLKEGLSL